MATMLLSSSCYQADLRLVAVVRQPSGICQAAGRQLAGSCQAVVRQSSGSHQAVIRQTDSRWKNESMVSGDPGKKDFSKQGTGKGTNSDIASGDKRGHSPITIIFQGWKGDNPRLSPFSGVGKGTALSMVLSSLVLCPSWFIIFGQQKDCAPNRIFFFIQTSQRGWSTAKITCEIL